MPIKFPQVGHLCSQSVHPISLSLMHWIQANMIKPVIQQTQQAFQLKDSSVFVVICWWQNGQFMAIGTVRHLTDWLTTTWGTATIAGCTTGCTTGWAYWYGIFCWGGWFWYTGTLAGGWFWYNPLWSLG